MLCVLILCSTVSEMKVSVGLQPPSNSRQIALGYWAFPLSMQCVGAAR